MVTGTAACVWYEQTGGLLRAAWTKTEKIINKCSNPKKPWGTSSGEHDFDLFWFEQRINRSLVLFIMTFVYICIYISLSASVLKSQPCLINRGRQQTINLKQMTQINHISLQVEAGEIFLCCVLVSFCAYSLTAQQTATAPRDAPWLLPTETARWPGAKTQAHTYTHEMKQLLKHNHSNPRDSVQWTKCTHIKQTCDPLSPVFPAVYQYSRINTS